MLINRRLMLLGGSAALGACATGTPISRVMGSPTEPVVETAQGYVRGRVQDGVSVFKGMRYGASTEGTSRFLPPKTPEPWAGVQDAFEYGDQSPQAQTRLAGEEPMTDDCLRINVWTPACDNAKRPVMLWFHGGGFEAGVGSVPVYDGTNVALRGDVVVCTINHRLNVFGHCYLGDVLGEDFAESSNVGYLDLVRAMNWVRENISQFGGDAGNVMIYGQSGGGRKVSLCFAGEDAEGLFHKGVVQSGSHLRLQSLERSNDMAYALLRQLDIPVSEAHRLQTVPVDDLTRAQIAVRRELGGRFSPTLDGNAFRSHPFYPDAPRISSHVPMMLGTTRTELTNQMGGLPGIFEMDEAQAKERLRTFIDPEDVDEAFSIFQASRPEANPSEVFFTIVSARGYRRDQTLMSEMRALGATAPTYVYRLMWRQPVEGGRRVSQHSLCLPFVFDNADKMEYMVGPETDSTRAMEDIMAGSWISFARNGNPNNPAIPEWRPYDLENRYTMMLDDPPHLEADPHRAEREFMERYPTQQLGTGAMHRR